MILPMMEVQLLGPRDALEDALAFLQARGVLQLGGPERGDDAGAIVRPCARAADGEALRKRLEESLARATALADRLPPARPREPEPLPPVGSPELFERLAVLDAELGRLEAARAERRAEAQAADRFAALVAALAPLDRDLDPALEPETHLLLLRRDPDALAHLREEVHRMTDGVCAIAARALAEGEVGVRVTVPRAHGRALTALLFERGVEEVKLPARYMARTTAESLLLLSARLRALPREIARAEAALSELSARVAAPLATAAANARAALARLGAQASCGETRFAFVVRGWMPAEDVDALRAGLAAAFGDRLTLFTAAPAPARFDEVPVLLRNPPALRPFQLLLGLVPLPRYGSLDPTPWIAIGFPLLFGFVLGDVVFGVLGIAAAVLACRRRWGGAFGRDVAVIVLACSASALAFGVLFGEALGELGAHVGLRPLIFDRRHGVMTFLGVAVGLGAVHVLLGIGLGIVNALRGGHSRHAAGRAAKLALLLAAAAWGAARLGALPAGAATPAWVIAAVALAVALVMEGPLALLELVLGVGNVLSYARLMALGLASVMLAEVANTLASDVRPAAAGLTLGVLLHAVNFTLGLISPTVAALRLHYVEFFEKFYDEGNVPWRPFALA